MDNFRKLAWYHCKFRIPHDWEITAYAVEDRAGRLEFSTRHGFQATLSWEPCKREPDIETMMLSFLRDRVHGLNSTQAVSVRDLKTRKVGKFLFGYGQKDEPTQAIHYLRDSKKLIRWVFVSSNKEFVKNVWPAILGSFELNNGAIREYAIYGLDFRLPQEFGLEDMAALPANVMIAFESNRRRRATFRRWGMPEVVLHEEPLEVFYTRFLGVQGCRAGVWQKGMVSGMEAVRVSYEQRGQHHMDRFMGRLWQDGEAWLWFDRDEMRLYAFEQIGPGKTVPLQFKEVFSDLTPKISGDPQ